MTIYIRPEAQHSSQPTNDSRSLGDLFSDLSQKASLLARQEVRLAKLEMQEKATEAATDIVLIAIGGLLGYAALLTLIAAIVLVLAQFVTIWLAALIVALVIAAGAGLLVWKGINGLKEMNPAPEQTIETLKEDKEWLTRQIQS